MTSQTAVAPRRRRAMPAWRRQAVKALVFGVIFPITKLFPRRWPRFVARSMTRFMSRFPPYEPTSHDVFVCSYFKSGTNWTMQMAVQIAYRGQAEFEHIHDLVAWPEFPDRAQYTVRLDDDAPVRAAPTGLRVIKTHLALDSVPYSTAARYICVVRDPKDVFVSSYFFMRAVGLGPLMPSVSRWLDVYLSRATAMGSWAEHLASCWRVRDRDNVLFLTYEEMRADLPGTVDRLAKFMDVAITAEERAAVIARSTFEYMKSIGHKFDPPGSPLADPRGAMMRRGQRGTSGELLSAADQRRIDDYWRGELARIGCDFPYARAFGEVPAVTGGAQVRAGTA